MKESYIFEYLNENEFKKLERSLKKYNMLAYKKMVFEFYPELKEGNFLGKMVSENVKENTKNYELKLPTDDLFVRVHGEVVLHYSVCENSHTVILDTITPESLLSEGHRQELQAYKGVMISKANQDKDKFKINLLNMLQNGD
ncbi:MAG TPA: hypothetical protein IAB68_04970 [Candidatus Aphodocola excrementigallinarum]|uniref:Uncharacterized protein n=1 Tax=Candidatus Aphodocola excrementigallinarum TaxID=2840670 RepID=A0A9D1LJ71_9FIRM|nr:hypothetical protein [Candidatus Aphodocola excrementigallinarum]